MVMYAWWFQTVKLLHYIEFTISDTGIQSECAQLTTIGTDLHVFLVRDPPNPFNRLSCFRRDELVRFGFKSNIPPSVEQTPEVAGLRSRREVPISEDRSCITRNSSSFVFIVNQLLNFQAQVAPV